METNAQRAVFLSYASQDAEAARRIAAALRAAGVEVWVDQAGGLEHGDEWDAKIRHQIKECVLFVPLISANTQARLEGYFRIEWELAAERAMGIAHGVPFILPVVIDDTREPDALVPERFQKVQWMRLPGGNVTPKVKERFLKLWSHRSGALAHQAAGASPTAQAALLSPDSAATSKLGARTYALVAAVILAILATVGWWLLSGPRAAQVDAVAAPGRNAATKLTTPPSAARQLADKASAIYNKISFTIDELELANDFARRATELEPELARAWGVRAYATCSYIGRGWDKGLARAPEVERLSKRALALDPEESEALLAWGQLLWRQNAPASQVETILRRVHSLAPDDIRARCTLGLFLAQSGRTSEGQALLKEAARLDPRNPLPRYNLATNYAVNGDYSAAWEQVEALLAIDPAFASGLLLKASLAARWKGDLAAMRDALDRIETKDRGDDRAVYFSMWGGLIERKPARVRAAAAFGTRDYLEDNPFTGPKAWLLALAYRIEGKESLAHQQWQAAEAVLRRQLRNDPSKKNLYEEQLAFTLAWLGQTDEAARLIDPIEKAKQEQITAAKALDLAKFYAALGDGARAVPYLQRALSESTGPFGLFTAKRLELEPDWDKLRGLPEFEALLKQARLEQSAKPASDTAPATSNISEPKR